MAWWIAIYDVEVGKQVAWWIAIYEVGREVSKWPGG